MTHAVAAAGFMSQIRAFYVICACGQEFITRVGQTVAGTGRYSDELMVERSTRRFREHLAATSSNAAEGSEE